MSGVEGYFDLYAPDVQEIIVQAGTAATGVTFLATMADQANSGLELLETLPDLLTGLKHAPSRLYLVEQAREHIDTIFRFAERVEMALDVHVTEITGLQEENRP